MGTVEDKDMESIGSLNDAWVRYNGYMTGAALRASTQLRGQMDSDDLYQEFFMILQRLHADPKFVALPVAEFTKNFYASINNFICNLTTQKRSRNRQKFVSLSKRVGGNTKGDTGRSAADYLERHELTDKAYGSSLIDILSNVSKETGKTILNALNPKIEHSKGFKVAYAEVKKYLTA